MPSRPRTPPPEELQLEPEQVEKLPAFIRDTDLNLHFRTFYFDRINPDDSVERGLGDRRLAGVSVGLALGHARHWGGGGYTSQPLYAPNDKDGTTLLAAGQGGITVHGQLPVCSREARP